MDTSPEVHPMPDMVCFSHLRWDFVYQRPQHLMSRFARSRRVLFIEEPVFEQTAHAYLRIRTHGDGMQVIVPVLPERIDPRVAISAQRELLTELIGRSLDGRPTFWFQTPMALPVAPLELAGVVVWDCMDELSAFQDAPASLAFNEKQLLGRADVVFTGGRALFEAKRFKHPHVHCLPSGIDGAHFARARRHVHGAGCLSEFETMPDGARAGFAGVIDERLDVDLLASLAGARPDVQFVMVGPVVKIDPGTLPRRENIHYLGFRRYDDLPDLMAEWDVAIMPFARNAATQYISPTKTPEYLAAGLRVVSTGILDVVRQYGDTGLVAIADDAAGFAVAIDAALAPHDEHRRLNEVDAALEPLSWDSVWAAMTTLEQQAIARMRDADVAEIDHAEAR